MQVQLKHAEISEAIRQYLTNQGISLKNKDVNIHFTAGRKENGLSADVSINDRDLLDIEIDDDEGKQPAAPHLAVVANDPEVVSDEAEEQPTPKVTNSLFA